MNLSISTGSTPTRTPKSEQEPIQVIWSGCTFDIASNRGKLQLTRTALQTLENATTDQLSKVDDGYRYRNGRNEEIRLTRTNGKFGDELSLTMTRAGTEIFACSETEKDDKGVLGDALKKLQDRDEADKSRAIPLSQVDEILGEMKAANFRSLRFTEDSVSHVQSDGTVCTISRRPVRNTVGFEYVVTTGEGDDKLTHREPYIRYLTSECEVVYDLLQAKHVTNVGARGAVHTLVNALEGKTFKEQCGCLSIAGSPLGRWESYGGERSQKKSSTYYKRRFMCEGHPVLVSIERQRIGSGTAESYRNHFIIRSESKGVPHCVRRFSDTTCSNVPEKEMRSFLSAAEADARSKR